MKQLRTLFSTVRLFAPLPTSSYGTSFVWRQLRCFLHVNKMFSRLILHSQVGQPWSFTSDFLVITAVVCKEKWKQFILIHLILIFSILGSIDVWSYMVLFYGDHPAHWRSILALYLLAATLFDNQKCLQILPNAFWESKSCLVEILLQYAVPLSVSLFSITSI